jgi:hypothetical protein
MKAVRPTNSSRRQCCHICNVVARRIKFYNVCSWAITDGRASIVGYQSENLSDCHEGPLPTDPYRTLTPSAQAVGATEAQNLT